MDKTKCFILLIAALLAGCQGSFQGGESQVYSGFDGVNLQFLRNTPPSRVFEDSTFPVVVRLRNLGAGNIKEGNMGILSLGVETDYNRAIDLQEVPPRVLKYYNKDEIAVFLLDGRSNENLKGDEEIVSYTVKAKKIDPQSERRTSTIMATACYPYTTTLSATVCIDTDVAGIKQKPKACSASDVIFDRGQGAPVAITKIETRMLPVEIESKEDAIANKIKPQFIIYIENRGNGEVIKHDKIEEMCLVRKDEFGNIIGVEDKNKLYNVILLKAYLSGVEDENLLECEPKPIDENPDSAYVKLIKRQDFVRCTVKDQNAVSMDVDAYSAPLNIKMEYGYTDTISARYTIEKQFRR